MGKRFARVKRHLRTWVQIGFTALSNGYAAGFMRGNIYKGPLKFACVPGLNCYSCPGALGSCPIGAFQSVLASRDYHFAFYVSGFLIFFGAVLGRLTCGWLCPFGLVQDLLHKLPFPWKRKLLPLLRKFRLPRLPRRLRLPWLRFRLFRPLRRLRLPWLRFRLPRLPRRLRLPWLKFRLFRQQKKRPRRHRGIPLGNSWYIMIPGRIFHRYT